MSAGGRAERDRLAVGAGRGMELRLADLADGPVGEGEIDLPGRGADLGRRESETPEERLRHAVMPLVLDERAPSLLRGPRLAPVPFDEAELLEGSDPAEGGRR